jgi:hypothetical protein
MSGIVSPLKTHDQVGMFSQQIDDLSLSLVSPLGSNDNKIGHVLLLWYVDGCRHQILFGKLDDLLRAKKSRISRRH